MIDKLRTTAKQALEHPMFRDLFTHIPKAEQNDPQAMKAWLRAAAEIDPKGSDRAPYKSAYAALDNWVQAEDFSSRVAALANSPALRAEFGAERIEAALKDPAAAREELRALSATGKLSKQADRALGLLYEAQEFSRQYDIPESPRVETPMPVNGAALQGEIDALRGKSINGTISKAEDARLDRLYEQRLAKLPEGATDEEKASHRKALGIPEKPARPDEYRTLISRSVAGKLTPEENSRLDRLSEARAVADGLMEAPAGVPDSNHSEGIGDEP
jgi:hypothetical protein